MQSSAAYVERMSFSQKLTIGINLGLENALGPQAAGSVTFFVDPEDRDQRSQKVLVEYRQDVQPQFAGAENQNNRQHLQ